jgi:GNAT superfamily N-acetyltransferase
MLSSEPQPARSPQFVIRRARAGDKEAVLAFCEHTYDWGDYIPLAWDDWLGDTQGALLVATSQDIPVGVAKVSMLTPTEAWLEGLRVHPDYRRRGLAWQFLVHCLSVARQCGAEVARLATSSQNLAVHKTLDRAHLRLVAAFQILEAPSQPAGESPLLAPLSLEDWPRVSAHILHSEALARAGGLYGSGWSWQQLTTDKLREHLAQGQILGVTDGNGLDAVAILTVVEEEKVLAVGYVDGDDAAAGRLAGALRKHAATLGLEEIEAVLPTASKAYPAFLSAGYKPEIESQAEVWVYEIDWRGVPS